MPNAIALTSEYMPHRRRGTAVTTMICGFSLGAAVGGFVAASIIPRFGWPAVFVVGGVTPLLIAAAAFVWLPDSIRFLLVKGGAEDRARDYLARIAPGAALPAHAVRWSRRARAARRVCGGAALHASPGHRHGPDLDRVLHEPPQPLLPEQLAADDHQRRRRSGGNRDQTDCALSSGRNRRRARARRHPRSRSSRSGFSPPAIYGRRSASSSSAHRARRRCWLGLTIASAGLGIIGGQNACHALTAGFYPTTIRSTGVGWALGIGRIGSIVGPVLGGLLLARGTPVGRVFWAAAIPALIATLAAAGIASITRGDPK